MKKVFTLLLILFSVPALAAGDGGVPWGLVASQVVNVFLTVVLLIFFSRKSVGKFLKERSEKYFIEKQKTEQIRKKAEERWQSIQARLQKLKATAQDSLSQAEGAAAKEKDELFEQAHLRTKQLEEGTNHIISIEKSRAIKALIREFLKKSLDATKKDLRAQATLASHQKLNTEFVSKIGVVQR